MKYALLDKNDVIVQTQPYEGEGFIKVEDDICCGMILKDGIFVLQEKTEEQLLYEWKAERDILVSDIKVTVDGLVFDGDETSQTRMARAIVSMNDTDTIQWVLEDNSVMSVTKVQLTEALRLSGEAQTALWVKS